MRERRFGFGPADMSELDTRRSRSTGTSISHSDLPVRKRHAMSVVIPSPMAAEVKIRDWFTGRHASATVASVRGA
jgi:hypothetical protein